MTKSDNSKTEIIDRLDNLFEKKGYRDYKWIDPQKIIVSQWVRMKCMFGCSGYGRLASCPPNVPSVAECEKFFNEYSLAVIFRFAKKLDDPEKRHGWSKTVNMKLFKLERDVFLAGHERAFLAMREDIILREAVVELRGIVGVDPERRHRSKDHSYECGHPPKAALPL